MFIDCPNCKARYRFQDSLQGKQVRCKKCDTPFLMDVSLAVSPAESSTSPQRTNAPASSGLQSQARSSSAPSRPMASSGSTPRPAAASETASRQAAPTNKPAQPPRQTQPAQPATQKTVQPVKSQPAKLSAAGGGVGFDADRWNQLAPSEKYAHVMGAFVGEFEKPRSTFSYQLGLMAATLFMLLIPLLYLAFIGLMIYGLYLHVVHNVGILGAGRGRGVIVVFLVYLAPIVIGSILILFLFKPFVARSGRSQRTRSLTENGEPLLFAHIARICKEVKAPMPKRIDVDNEINASASFRNGFWSMLRGKDLVLTIGMPLVAGLSLQQFTGVLAHEFGHFSQGAGMRLSRLLHMVSDWLRRAVYERDAWDEWLEESSRELELGIGWILYLTRFAIWLSRRVLWGFLMLGYALTGYILKQMEYDADRYEAAMSGRNTFADTSRNIRKMSVGYERSLNTLSESMSEGKRIDNFTKLSLAQTSKLGEETEVLLEQFFQTEKSVWYQSHPCDRDRVNAVSRYPEQGCFRSNLPASALFKNFDATCIGATEDFYKLALGKSARKLKVVQANSIIEEASFQDQAWESLAQFFMGAASATRLFPFPSYQLNPPESEEKGLQLLKQTRKLMLDNHKHYLTLEDVRQWRDDKQRFQHYYEAVSRWCSKVDRELLQMDPLDKKLHIDPADPAKRDLFVKATMIRLHAACSLLKLPSVVYKIERAEEMADQVTRILRALKYLDAELKTVVEFSNRYQFFGIMLKHFMENSNNQLMAKEILDLSKDLLKTMHGLRIRIRDHAYPFEHAKANMTLGKFLVPEVADHEDVGEVMQAGDAFISQFHQLRGRSLAHLVVTAQSVEQSLGLLPINLPKE